jgi:N-acetylglucosaminyldiphosphoundecaprenol N-acetyl-beta-D-mannosaminyltransferase
VTSIGTEALIKTYEVCGIPIAAVTVTQAAEEIVGAADGGRGMEAHLCNAYTLSLVSSDELLRAALLRADLNLPDGTPVAWFGRRFGVRGPVRGVDLVRDVARLGVRGNVRHYFYGGPEGVAAEAVRRLATDVPGCEIVGYESPPFRYPTDDDLNALADRLSSARANVAWVGLGTPRQDYVVPRLAQRTTAVVVPVGAAFDFLAGRSSEAPAPLHGTGAEWVYRLARDPRRLWRRYLLGNPRFIAHVVRERLLSTKQARPYPDVE